MRKQTQIASEYFVVVNADGDVLGVYGSALRDMAEALVTKLAPFAKLVEHRGARPSVGQRIAL